MQKVYIPDTARSNQYILAELPLTDALIAAYPDLSQLYVGLSKKFFQLCHQFGLRHSHFIANDKLPVVRFHQDAFVFQTHDQILFFYNPAFHESQQAFFDGHYRARKISLLLLGSGEELRSHAAEFHQQVRQLVLAFQESLPVAEQRLKVRDHQHISYDLFARAKGCQTSYGYKMRAMDKRYHSRGCLLPADTHLMNYVTVSLPFTRQLKEVLGGSADPQAPFSGIFVQLEDLFHDAANAQQLRLLGLVADGTVPLVRNSHSDKARASRELRLLSFDIQHPEPELQSFWHPDQLPDTVHLVIAASDLQQVDGGYARFLNRVEDCLKQLSKQLELNSERQDLLIRFHQHLSYSV